MGHTNAQTSKTGDMGHAHHHHEHGSHEDPMSSESAVNLLLLLGQTALDAGDYESAAEAFGSILKLEQNETAFYNLGSFYARGLGLRQDFVEGARLFHQAELLGNERAGKLCGKCMYDYMHKVSVGTSPVELYAAMAVFVERVYTEVHDKASEVSRGLFAIAATHLNKREYTEAARFLRAAAELCNDGYAQFYLAMLYHAGAGLQQNDLVALYWLDCAVDNGAADLARNERDTIMDAYRQNLSDVEFSKKMAKLADWCESGTPDVPANPAKSTRWRELA